MFCLEKQPYEILCSIFSNLTEKECYKLAKTNHFFFSTCSKYLFNQYISKYSTKEIAYVSSCREGKFPYVKKFIEIGLDPICKQCQAFDMAYFNGYYEICSYLLNINRKEFINYTLITYSTNSTTVKNSVEMLKITQLELYSNMKKYIEDDKKDVFLRILIGIGLAYFTEEQMQDFIKTFTEKYLTELYSMWQLFSIYGMLPRVKLDLLYRVYGICIEKCYVRFLSILIQDARLHEYITSNELEKLFIWFKVQGLRLSIKYIITSNLADKLSDSIKRDHGHYKYAVSD